MDAVQGSASMKNINGEAQGKALNKQFGTNSTSKNPGAGRGIGNINCGKIKRMRLCNSSNFDRERGTRGIRLYVF
jgi:hypothetical protein